MTRYLILSLVLAVSLSACYPATNQPGDYGVPLAAPSRPPVATPWPATPTPVYSDLQRTAEAVQFEADQARKLADAQGTRQAQDSAATATATARVWLDGQTATYSAMDVISYQVALSVTAVHVGGQLLTMTPQVQAMELSVTKTAGQATAEARVTQQAEADAQAARLERQKSAAWWAQLWSVVGNLALFLVVIVGLVLLAVPLVLLVGVTFVTGGFVYFRLRIEAANADFANMVRLPDGRLVKRDRKTGDLNVDVVDGQFRPAPPAKGDHPPAGAARALIPVGVGAGDGRVGIQEAPAPWVVHRKGKGDADVNLVLDLLRDALVYRARVNPSWPEAKVPGYRELNLLDKRDPDESRPARWSGSRWDRATKLMARYLDNQGGGEGNGLWLDQRQKWRTLAELYEALARQRTLVLM